MSKNYPTAHARFKRNVVNREREQAKRRVTPAGLLLTLAKWEQIVHISGYSCVCCGAIDKLTIDHVIPLSKGGMTTPDNVQPLCYACNNKKDSEIADYRSVYLTEFATKL